MNFDVVLLKDGVNGMDAKPEDIMRIPIQANTDDAMKLIQTGIGIAIDEGAIFVAVAAPGHATALERDVRRRSTAS